MKVIVLKCPACGAHLESNRTHCEHCGTAVKLSDDKKHFIGTGVSCPHCGEGNHIGDKHCGSCGAKLISICPVPNCHEENNVWRKFCRKCGRDIIGYHVEMLEITQATFYEELQQHSREIDRIQKELSGSKGRETGVKVTIWIIGGLISLAFLSAQNGWIGTVITLIITGLIAGCYHSSENENLLNSLVMHQEDIERIQEHYETNQLKLERIKQA
jgi:hypothetical protein